MRRKIFGFVGLAIFAPPLAGLYIQNKRISFQNEEPQLPKLKPEFIKPNFVDMSAIAISVVKATIFNNDINQSHSYSCPNRKELNDDANTHPTVQSVNQFMDKSGIKLSEIVLGFIKKTGEIDAFHKSSSLPFKFAVNNHRALKDTKNEQKISQVFFIDARFIQYQLLKSSEHQLDEQNYKELCANYVGIFLHSILATIKQAFVPQVIYADMFSNGLDSGASRDYYLSKSAQVKLLDKIQEKLEFGIALYTALKRENLSEAQRYHLIELAETNEKKLLTLCNYFKQSEDKQFIEDNLPENKLSDFEQDYELGTILGTTQFIETLEEGEPQMTKPVVHSYRLFREAQLQESTSDACAIMKDFWSILGK